MLRPCYILVPLILCGAVSLALGQRGIPDKIGADTERGPSKSAVLSRAEKSAERGDYYAAMHYYYLILHADSLDAQALEGYGKAAMAYTQYDSATWAFQRLLDHNLVKNTARIKVLLADVLYRQGGYAQAILMDSAIVAMNDATATDKDDARKGIKKAFWAINFMDGSTESKVIRLKPDVYSPYAEYAPLLVDNKLYFTAYRYPMNGDSNKMLMEVLTATKVADSLKVEPVDFNDPKKHTAYTTFNADKTVMYFAVGKYSKNDPIRFDLYRRKKIAGSDSWGAAELLPAKINVPDATNTQPNVGTLPGDDKETLFFVSNRPGGLGGKDIWYCRIQGDTFSAPQNLKSLNTKGDDVSPFYFAGSGDLYFSSTGYEEMNLGGFDIFRSRFSGGKWQTTEALPSPYNSGNNDLFFSITDCNVRFFASNRSSESSDEAPCCYDIYSSEKSLEIKIDVFHKITQEPLTQVRMQFFEKTPYGLTAIKTMDVPGNFYTFPLQEEKSYALITSKNGFRSDTLYFDTYKNDWGKCLEAKQYLVPIKIDLQVYVHTCDSDQPLTGAELEYEDKYALKPDGGRIGDPKGGALEIKTQTTDTREYFHYDLLPNHVYALGATKDAFTPASTGVSTLGIEHDTTLRRELILCQGLYFCAHAFDELSKDPLDSITFRLIELDTVKITSLRTVDTQITGAGDNAFDTVIIGYNRRFRIVAERQDYFPDSLDFRTDLNGKPYDILCRDLFLRPKNLLPIVLYYDNDYPNPHTLDTTTNKLYVETYWPYDTIRKPEYLRECCGGLPDNDPERLKMQFFFKKKVELGWEKLRAFRENLSNILDSGKCVTVKVAGHASPRGNAKYNANLSHRRVDCVLNHLRYFEGARYFEDYLKSGCLVIEPDYRGDKDADRNVVPSASKDKKSIYSVEAAEQRNVVILEMIVRDDNVSQRKQSSKNATNSSQGQKK